MTETPEGPDWAALYIQHRDAMYRVAARMLRDAGLADRAVDAVQDAMVSLMKSPPAPPVHSWEAILVTAAKRKALDLLGSAAVRHSGPELDAERHAGVIDDFTDQVDEQVDRQRLGAVLWDKLAVLDTRERHAVWEYTAKGRPRKDVADELGVTPARVNQLATQAMRKLKDALREEGVERGV